MMTDLSLETAYTPKALYFHESDCVEYLRSDASCVYKRIDAFLTIALEMDTRKPIGFRIKGFKNIYLRTLKPVYDKLDEARFVYVVSVIEGIVQAAGDSVFPDEETHEAYRLASEIARNDRVELHDLPIAA